MTASDAEHDHERMAAELRRKKIKAARKRSEARRRRICQEEERANKLEQVEEKG